MEQERVNVSLKNSKSRRKMKLNGRLKISSRTISMQNVTLRRRESFCLYRAISNGWESSLSGRLLV